MKKIFNNPRKISALVLCLALCAPQVSWAQSATKPMKTPKPLTAGELYTIYHDKTWKWPTGGGRFMSEGRKFVAVTESNGTSSLGEGTWTIDGKGMMCMRGKWKTGGSAAKANTCFAHGKIGNVLYQKRQPDGKWYVFRHNPPRADDEFSKLVKEDRVTMKVLEFKQAQLNKQ